MKRFYVFLNDLAFNDARRIIYKSAGPDERSRLTFVHWTLQLVQDIDIIN